MNGIGRLLSLSISTVLTVVVVFHRSHPTTSDLVLLNGAVDDAISRRCPTIRLLVTLLQSGGLSNRVSSSLI